MPSLHFSVSSSLSPSAQFWNFFFFFFGQEVSLGTFQRLTITFDFEVKVFECGASEAAEGRIAILAAKLVRLTLYSKLELQNIDFAK